MKLIKHLSKTGEMTFFLLICAFLMTGCGTVAEPIPQWTVDFFPDIPQGYSPLCVAFTLDAPAGDFVWNFGDGTSSTSRAPTHCYRKAGMYTVSLTYFIGGATDTITKKELVTVLDPDSRIDFSVSPSEGKAPLEVEFSLIGHPSTYTWHFGDGIISSERKVSHVYEYGGIYTPKLSYCYGGTCDEVVHHGEIVVQDPDYIDFEVEVPTGTAPLCTRFVPIGDIEVLSWDIGDSKTYFTRSPAHCYKDPGTYTATMTYVVNGVTQSLTKENCVEAWPSAPPTITARIREGFAPLCVPFEASGNPEKPTTLLWNFGTDKANTDSKTIAGYGKPGTYDVTLSYCYGELCREITEYDYITVREPIIYTEPAGPADDIMSYRLYVEDGDGLSYSWNFGDGSYSNDVSPVHTFPGPGIYRIAVHIVSSCTSVSIVSKDIEISGPSNPDFSATPLTGCAPHGVQFSEQSALIPKSRQWDFGDGTTSDLRNPFHVYESPGTYSVSVIYEFADPLFAGVEQVTKEELVTVYAVPQAVLEAVPTHGQAPLSVQFMDRSMGPAMTHSFDFGDGQVSFENNPMHQFVKPGTYTTTLQVCSDGGCCTEDRVDIYVDG